MQKNIITPQIRGLEKPIKIAQILQVSVCGSGWVALVVKLICLHYLETIFRPRQILVTQTDSSFRICGVEGGIVLSIPANITSATGLGIMSEVLQT